MIFLILTITIHYSLLSLENKKSKEIRWNLMYLSDSGEKAIEKLYTPSISLKKFREVAGKIFEDEVNPITKTEFIHEDSPGNYTITQKGEKFFFTVYDINGSVYRRVEFSKEKYLHNISTVLIYNAISYNKSKQYEEAIELYSKAIEVDPKNAYTYYCRGFSFYRSKKYDKALKDYNKAVELAPNYSLVYNKRGKVYLELKRYKKAIEDWKKAISLGHPDSQKLRKKIKALESKSQ